jgi:hypothetical protein
MGLATATVLWLAPTPVQAVTVTYNLDYVFSPPTGSVSPPPATVTLTDLAGGAVKFDVVNQNGVNTKLDSLFFNFTHETVNPNQLGFSNVTVAGNPLASNAYTTLLAPTTSSMVGALKADGDGYFDGKFQFSGNNFLANGQTLSFQLSVVGQTLGVGDFNFLSLPGGVGGSGPFAMAAMFKNQPPVWVGAVAVAAVPLPGAALLFASGLSGITWWRRRRLYPQVSYRLI